MILSEYIFFGILVFLGLFLLGYFLGFVTKIIVSAIYEVKQYYENKSRKEEKE